ncbi:MAG: hypothetical protein PF448_14270 [Bacteroidales bacterium]|jgi:hypothetical protein|nr:hypothetical protein [Bacteroidales bacterium]
MKRYTFFIMLAIAGFYLTSCTLEPSDQIVGTWTWIYAENSSGEDLMNTYDYNTAIFFSDGTYDFDIGSASHTGTYLVDNVEETITLDGVGVWDLIELTNSSLKMKGQSETWYEWHFDR